MITWRWPTVLAALTMFALLSALIGEKGIWVWLSWLTLSIPLAVITVAIWRARGSG